MMKQPTKDGFAQKKIGSKKPDGFSDNPIRAQLTLGLEQRGRAIDLVMVAGKACDEAASNILRQTKEGEFYLAIEKDTIISFALSDKIDWRWNQKQAAFHGRCAALVGLAVVGLAGLVGAQAQLQPVEDQEADYISILAQAQKASAVTGHLLQPLAIIGGDFNLLPSR